MGGTGSTLYGACAVNGTPVCHCNVLKQADSALFAIHSPAPDVRIALRKLFSDHGWLTLEYITAAVFSLPFAPQIRQRLLDNQTEIGQQLGLQPGVGSENGAKIGQLFIDHIVEAEKVVLAAIAASRGNSQDNDDGMFVVQRVQHSPEELQAAIKTFYRQGDKLSVVLAAVLRLPVDTVVNSFRMHTKQVVELATLLIGRQNGAGFVALQDLYISHLLKLADVIYSALIELQ